MNDHTRSGVVLFAEGRGRLVDLSRQSHGADAAIASKDGFVTAWIIAEGDGQAVSPFGPQRGAEPTAALKLPLATWRGVCRLSEISLSAAAYILIVWKDRIGWLRVTASEPRAAPVRVEEGAMFVSLPLRLFQTIGR